MEEINMLDSIERYIRGEMLPEERVFFEHLRKSSPSVDQMVVEHTIFLNRMNKYGERKQFQRVLEDVHGKLEQTGELSEFQPGRLVRIWKKYQRVVAVAASIAGITALAISGLVSYVSPKSTDTKYQQLSRRLDNLDKKQNALYSNIINEMKQKEPVDAKMKLGGTGFMVDVKGYLLTDAHILSNARAVVVQNYKGEQYKATILLADANSDLAILKIDDEDFKPYAILPYGISRSGADLGEPIFTMGYPRDEIVYGEGYMSAKTGFEGDTLACQIAVAANPGNSGGPVLNKNGEIIGVLSARQMQAQGVVFAIKAKYIYKVIDSLKTDTSYSSIRLPANTQLKGMERIQQVKRLEDCIFLVKTY
jgi:S1-C subfamily serine protease